MAPYMGDIPNGVSANGVAALQDGKDIPIPIAIVGMACHLPGGVSDLDSFWEFCESGSNAWAEFPKERLDPSAFYHPNPEKSGTFHIKGAHFLKDSIAKFDASFFNITAEEAKSVDPRHRLLLECVYEALENGGIPMKSIAGQDMGVFVSNTLSHYELQCLRDPDTAPRLQYFGCADSLLANRISYFFDLRGASVSVDTACSSSLAALHLACQTLRAGEVTSAIVGGCHLNIMPEMMAAHSSSMLYSATGRCFPFDSRVSGGFGPGEGAACIVLKPLREALAAGDNIRAVIRNTGMNQDGRTNGISMPSTEAQAALIRSVYKASHLDPADTQYVEAHGTGTTVGDPLEAAAFASTFATRAKLENPIYLGSAKSNFGHLEGVSGMVSVIKSALMLEKKIILPNADFEAPNPKISSLQNVLKIPTTPIKWSSTGVRRASINNLGFGGTNAHAILEEASGLTSTSEFKTNGISKDLRNRTTSRITNSISKRLNMGSHAEINDSPTLEYNGCIFPSHRLYVLTANDKNSVTSHMDALSLYLKRQNSESEDLMSNLAYTLGQRRSLLPWRTAYAASTLDDLVEQIKSAESAPTRATKEPKLGFVFTGQGAHWYAMGRELSQAYPIFASAIDDADRHLKTLGASWSLIDELSKDSESSQLRLAYLSQPACTAIQLALVKLLNSWGIRPSAVTGHSSGEFAAAFAAGALSFESAMTVAYFRGLLAAKLKDDFPDVKGGMLAIGTNAEDGTAMMAQLQQGIAVVACINSPSSITASGDVQAIAELQVMAEERKLFCRRLPVDIAYHSPHMNFIGEQYRKSIEKVKPGSGKKAKFYSSLLGRHTSTFALGSSYWVANLKNPVQFSDSLLHLCSLHPEAPASDEPITHLVEIGPHAALKGPIRDILGAAPKTKYKIQYSSALIRNQSAVASTMKMASELFMNGCQLNMEALNFPTVGAQSPTLLSNLPKYSWNHENEYWHESRLSKGSRMRPWPRNDILGARTIDSNDLEPRWRNIIRLDEIPWLRDHRIRSNVVYPFTGYIAMAIEAITQNTAIRLGESSRVNIREISVSQALVIPETTEVETMFTLKRLDEGTRRSSDTWHDFKVFSWTTEGGWMEHCRGQIAIISERKLNDVEAESAHSIARSNHRDQIKRIENACVSPVDSHKLYEGLSNIGFDYGPSMAGLTDCRVGDKCATAFARVPDTASGMPHQFEPSLILHPAFLDTCIQIFWPILGVGQTELDGLYLPTFIKNMSINPRLRTRVGDRLRVIGTTSRMQSTECCIDCITVVDPNSDECPGVTYEGLVLAALPDISSTREKKDNTGYLRVEWQPSLDLLKPEEFQEYFKLEPAPGMELRRPKVFERAALHYFEAALRHVTDDQYELLHAHHKQFYLFMKQQLALARKGENPRLDAQWEAMNTQEQKELPQLLRSLGTTGELICKVGPKIYEILSEGVDPHLLMSEDDLLGRYYRSAAPLMRNYLQAAMLINNIAHENPELRILEVGAGTGGASFPILEVLGGGAGEAPRFKEYVFTDISDECFGPAQAQIRPSVKPLVTFRKLDLNSDPITQGFEPESFDLIVASDVLHTTRQMKRTMDHVRKLLKPGARLLAIEITTPMAQLFPLALLPGWWAGEDKDRQDYSLLTEERWNAVLKQTGFSGVDRRMQDYPGQAVQSHTLMLSTATSTEVEVELRDIIIISSHKSNRFSLETLQGELSSFTRRTPKTMALKEVAQADLADAHCIFLDELVQPMLVEPSATDFKAIQRLISAPGILWVLEGAQVDPSNSESGMAVGLSRAVRAEDPTIRLVTLDLDGRRKLSPSRTSELIADLYRSTFTCKRQDHLRPMDMEYMERNGSLHIPRLVQDSDLDHTMQKASQRPVPELQTYKTYLQENRNLVLNIQTPGFLDSLYFGDETTDEPIQPNEVEIQVKAWAINFRDVMIALGKIPYDGLGSDCAGVISKVGSAVTDLAVGDRVCAFSPGALSTSFRCPGSSAAIIPNTTDFSIAASLPTTCATVYQALVNIAGLSRGESILIHAAAGGVGQSAIMLAQSIGAEIFVTVGSVKKKKFLMGTYAILEDHIFYSRDTSFEEGVMRMTNGQGVDVVLNSLAGDSLRATWRCLAEFGRFTEIGKTDFLANSRLEMEPFFHNRIYAGVDLLGLSAKRPKQTKRLMNAVISLHAAGVFRPVSPITTFPLSAIETALRTMQSGDNMGKIVLLPQLDDQIKILPSKTAMSTIRPDATYLITGGSGGIAGSSMKWLADQGAKHIILASRSGCVDQKNGKLIEELRLRGSNITSQKCDVTQKADVEQLVKENDSISPPIRGVIHCAMVHRIGLFGDLSYEDYMAIVKPKVTGAINVHNALLGAELDFFVSMGSITGTTGNMGQSGYCASATFLDSFTAYRNSLGLPATTLNFGVVPDTGIIANTHTDLLAPSTSAFGTQTTEKEVLTLLDAAISGRVSASSNYRAITGLEYQGTDAQIFWTSDPRFSHLKSRKGSRKSSTPADGEAISTRQALKSVSAVAAAKTLIYDALAAKFSKVLMIDEEDVNPNKALGSYGVDSLVAVELRNWIAREMDATVILMDLLADNTLGTLTETVFGKSKLCERVRSAVKEE